MATETTKTEVGSYFIANYPPFSQWSPAGLDDVRAALNCAAAESPPAKSSRRRWACICTFPSAASAASSATSASTPTRTPATSRPTSRPCRARSSWSAACRVMGGRPFRFVYFGGGTPSFLSAKQLTSLVDRLRANINWDHAEEVTFECEPGTLSRAQGQNAARAGRHAAQPGRREFRRRRARRKRPGPSLGRSLQIVGLDPCGRLSRTSTST